MVQISVCVGSACHLRGSHAILNAFHCLLDKYKVRGKVADIEGCFCQGHCTESVVIKINDEVITNVSVEQVHDIFIEKVLGGKVYANNND